MINRKRVEGDIEKKLLTGMITSKAFLRDLQPMWNPTLLDIPWVRTVGGWCMEYWVTYEDAPAMALTDIFDSKVRRRELPSREQDLVEAFLAELSEEFEQDEQFNSDYWLDEVERYFETQSLKQLSEDVKAYVSEGDVTEARELVEQYTPTRRPKSLGFDPFNDEDLLERAFEEATEPLFKFPDALGKFINPLLVRESLIGIMAPEKRGKTFLLMELALQAVRQGRNVVFFSIGDMTETQMVRRIGMRLTGRNYMKSECGPALSPIHDCVHNQLDNCTKRRRVGDMGCKEVNDAGKMRLTSTVTEIMGDGYLPCDVCRVGDPRAYKGASWWQPVKVRHLDYEEAQKAVNRFKARNKGGLRLFSYASGEINIRDAEADLEQLARNDFVADVVVVDYADLMAPEDTKRSEERIKHNDTWSAMSALRKKWHLCCIAATQTDTDSYNVRDIGMKNFSESKGKNAHVTAAIAINQTAEEKEDGLVRLGLVVAREQEFSASKQVRLLQCLKMGKPALGSF